MAKKIFILTISPMYEVVNCLEKKNVLNLITYAFPDGWNYYVIIYSVCSGQKYTVFNLNIITQLFCFEICNVNFVFNFYTYFLFLIIMRDREQVYRTKGLINDCYELPPLTFSTLAVFMSPELEYYWNFVPRDIFLWIMK